MVALVCAETFDESRLMGHPEITDACLLALAIANDGVLVTFHSAIAATGPVVHGAAPDRVLVLSCAISVRPGDSHFARESRICPI